jgi:hypothetical protein
MQRWLTLVTESVADGEELVSPLMALFPAKAKIPSLRFSCSSTSSLVFDNDATSCSDPVSLISSFGTTECRE